MLVYFVPENIQFENLASIGLSHICDRPQDFLRRQLISGPHGFQWVIGSKESIPETSIGYFPGRQETQSFTKFAIGRFTDSPFNPESLLRKTAVSGHEWTDWAGNKWTIPVARRWVDSDGKLTVQNSLPQFLSINDQEEWVFGGVLPRYAALWRIATEFFAASITAESEAETGQTYTVSLPDLDDICGIVFGANYRVSKYEMAFLKSLTAADLIAIMRLVIDEPGFEQLQKKTT